MGYRSRLAEVYIKLGSVVRNVPRYVTHLVTEVYLGGLLAFQSTWGTFGLMASNGVDDPNLAARMSFALAVSALPPVIHGSIRLRNVNSYQSLNEEK